LKSKECITLNNNLTLDKPTELKTRILSCDSKDVQMILDSENVLGVIEYNNGKQSLCYDLKSEIPFISVHMDSFDGKSYVEIWTSNKDVLYGTIGNLHFAADKENLFATGSFEESFEESKENMDSLGEKIYNEMFKSIYALHYPYTYRMWNYFPLINQYDINGLERYKAFCYGRALAFANYCNFSESNRFPSATGIGSMSGNVNVCFISSSIPYHIHIENPRQTPAYKYPIQYGPKPPSFARATYYKRSDDAFNLYISGTASIIGHKTEFIGDIEQQCITTIDNIEILISEKNLSQYNIEENLKLEDIDCIKVYIRNESDYEIVKSICEKKFSPKSTKIYIKADVCRKDLLVEIEGIIQK
jgi:FkbO/Hyg5 family chorismatase